MHMSESETVEVPATNALITFCEENFECEPGMRRAFHEFPRPGIEDPVMPDDYVNVRYSTYAMTGFEFDDLED